MKKLFTLLFLAFTALSLRSYSQQTNGDCNASFNFSISNLSVTFSPAITKDTSANHSYWSFGDGSSSSTISPVHVYTSAGTYSVKHYFYRTGTSGTAPLCIDSAEKQVVLTVPVTVCDLHAKFSFERDSTQPNTIKFTNLSTPVNDIKVTKWSFGDGSYSYDFNTSHTYAASGSYTVCLSILNSTNTATACIRDTCINIQVQVPPPYLCNINPDFTWRTDSTNINKIYFTNTSTPITANTTVIWFFGDSTSSTSMNPDHIYAHPGTYNVCVRVSLSTSCYKYMCKTVEIKQAPILCNIQPNFTWRIDSVNKGKLYFTSTTVLSNTSAKFSWSFGDGTSSTSMNPDHTFTQSGTYTVCLRVYASSICSRDICKTVEVKLPELCNIQPDFTWKADSANTKKLYFTNTTVLTSNAAKFVWNFGDGTTTSDSQNPYHIYDHTGTYTVCLTIYPNYPNSTCSKQVCKTVEVKDPEINCQDISKFNIVKSTANCLEFKFVPVNQNANWQYHWSFGDGTGSNDMSPSHVYQHSGTYTVFLTVYRSASCVSTSYNRVETGTCFSCSNVSVKFEYTRSTSLAQTISFQAVSNYPILSQTWTINKLSVSGSVPVILNTNNPVYTFNEPGEYNVCLKVVTQGQCIKEYCEVINIPSPTVCTLSAYPNPAHNVVALSLGLTEPQMIHVYVYNSLNVLMKQKDQQGSTGNNLVTLNIEDLINGWYTVKVVYGNKICYSRFQKI